MPTRIRTGALAGIAGIEVTAEVDVSRGLPGFHIVGLPGAEVRESRQRVMAALRNCGLTPPPGRITVNLAPAGLRKEGASFDLAIALGVLAAAGARGGGALRSRAGDILFLGELSLFGEIRPVRGVLAIVGAAAEAGCRTVVVPQDQAAEAALVSGVEVLGARDLGAVAAWLRGEGSLPGPSPAPQPSVADPAADDALRALSGLAGQALARKAALVAAVGRHNLLMIGPPGSGKTRLARLIGSLQPPLTGDEALAVTAIRGAAGLRTGEALEAQRPFRAPHHTATRVGLVGGGATLQPGEATLAHGGILFLDELAEFTPAVLDSLREPLEDGVVTIVRGAGRRTYPAAFQLLAATNPCRCGRAGDRAGSCECTPAERRRYLGRLSGPLLDRIDLFVEVGAWSGPLPAVIRGAPPSPSVAGGDWRLGLAWEELRRAQGRAADGVSMAPDGASRLQARAEALGLSLRAATRCRRVAGTLAALDAAAQIGARHVDEALEFRPANALPPLAGTA